MKTTTLRLSAVALATAFGAHQAAHAAATEAQLRSIKLYSNVSIQEDSTSSWGPWSEFEPPAAGNTNPVAFAPGSGDLYRPLAQTAGGTTPQQPEPPVTVSGCAAGGLCGFGAFQAMGDPNNSEGGGIQAIHPVRLDGTVLQGPGEVLTYLPRSIQLLASELSTGTFLLPDSGTLNLFTNKGIYYQQAGSSETSFYSFRPDTFLASYYDPKETQVTLFVLGQLGAYVRGDLQQQAMWGVIGTATSADQMATLRASNFQATYIGNDYYNNLGTNSGVVINASIGDGTFTATLNGGRDGASVQQHSIAGGGTMLTGAVGITASGIIEGSNFRSTSVGSLDAGAKVTGSWTGAFYGPNAAAAGGVIDVTKSMPAVQPTNNANPAAAGGYTDGRYVSPFLAVRSDLVKGGNNRD